VLDDQFSGPAVLPNRLKGRKYVGGTNIFRTGAANCTAVVSAKQQYIAGQPCVASLPAIFLVGGMTSVFMRVYVESCT
jgi:hypothetical protein